MFLEVLPLLLFEIIVLHSPDSVDTFPFYGGYEDNPSCDSPVRIGIVLVIDSSCLLTWPVTTFQMNVTPTFNLRNLLISSFPRISFILSFSFLFKTHLTKNPNNSLIV